jgi:hypothetical protein
MLSTTVEPECRRRPFVTWCAIAADEATEHEATKLLVHTTIQPTADRAGAYSSTARADSAAVC